MGFVSLATLPDKAISCKVFKGEAGVCVCAWFHSPVKNLFNRCCELPNKAL